MLCYFTTRFGRSLQYFADKACQREIDALLVRCSNALGGCRWSGAFKELASHLSTCQVRARRRPRPTPRGSSLKPSLKLSDSLPFLGAQVRYCECPNGCGRSLRQDLLEEHQTQHCLLRAAECTQCGAQIIERERALHVELHCPRTPVPCPNACVRALVPREEVRPSVAIPCACACACAGPVYSYVPLPAHLP